INEPSPVHFFLDLYLRSVPRVGARGADARDLRAVSYHLRKGCSAILSSRLRLDLNQSYLSWISVAAAKLAHRYVRRTMTWLREVTSRATSWRTLFRLA